MQKFANPLFSGGRWAAESPLQRSTRHFGEDLYESRVEGAAGAPSGGPAAGRRETGVEEAFALVFAGEATVGAVATVVATVGVGMSVVGAVTGNQNLVKIGGVLSLVGGGLGLASSAGLIGSAAADTVVGGAGVGADVMTGSQMADFAAGPATGAAGAAASDIGTVNNLQNIANPSGVSTPSDTTPLDTTASNPAATPATNPAAPGSPAAPSVDTSAAPAPNAGTAQVAPSAPGADPSIADMGGMPALPTPSNLSLDGIKQWFGNLPKDMQGHVVTGLVQAGGQAVGGIFNGWSAEQKLALQQAQFALQQQQYGTAIANAQAQPKIAYAAPGIIGGNMGTSTGATA